MRKPELSASTEEVVFECRDLSARYASISVLREVSFSMLQGRMLAVLGVNGAGKSSLLGALAGVVSSAGSVRIRGVEIGGWAAVQSAALGISLVPERRGNIFPELSVQENMHIGLRLLPASEREAWQEHLLAMFPILRTRWKAVSGMLSGGEQQMLAIAMALGRKPSVLLLDEPTQGLAPTIFDTLEQTFVALKETGMALLLTEQNISFARRVADDFLVLSRGGITRRGTGSELADIDQVAKDLLGAVNNATPT